MQALRACASDQTYSIGDRTLARQDLPEVRAEVKRWYNTVTALEAQEAGRTRLGSTPQDFLEPGAVPSDEVTSDD